MCVIMIWEEGEDDEGGEEGTLGLLIVMVI